MLRFVDDLVQRISSSFQKLALNGDEGLADYIDGDGVLSCIGDRVRMILRELADFRNQRAQSCDQVLCNLGDLGRPFEHYLEQELFAVFG